MLSFFPKPYPGEWLYSVLCRYHVRSGNPKQQTSVVEIFGGKTQAAMASTYPNDNIRLLFLQLPERYLSTEHLAVENTLLPYFKRFDSQNKKREAIDRVRLQEPSEVITFRRFPSAKNWTPRFCPDCVRADRKQFGEAYWRIIHQIPLMTVCPEHGCYLMTFPAVDVTHLKYTFYPLEGLKIEEAEPLSGWNADWELQLARILTDYQTLSFNVSPPSHNNLAMALSNMGYGIIQRSSPNVILDTSKLYQDLRDYYGAELLEQYFGTEKSAWQINRACKWEMTSTERYAMLQCFAGISTEIMFSENAIKDKYEVAIKKLAESSDRKNRATVATELGVTLSQLTLLTDKYDIQTFRRDGGEKLTEAISSRFTGSEMESIFAAVQRGEARSMSEFLRKCVREHFENA